MIPRNGRSPLIAVTADRRRADGYHWHGVPEPYLTAIVCGFGGLPLIVPALGPLIDIETLLDRVDGVLATGSRSNVRPSLYGERPSRRAEPYDQERDATSLPLIRAAIARGVPLLAICRGMQELNVALGGTLHPKVHEVQGRSDHRAPEAPDNDGRFALTHAVVPVPGGQIAAVLGGDPLKVNSLHHQAVDRLAPGLLIAAAAPDGTVEAVSVKDAPAFALGVQWHPEYWVRSDPPSARLFAAFGEAAREYMARGRRLAAE